MTHKKSPKGKAKKDITQALKDPANGLLWLPVVAVVVLALLVLGSQLPAMVETLQSAMAP